MKERIEALKAKSSYTVSDLREIMEVLRAPDGCPWDREQDHKSIRRNLIEETYEVVEAIDTDNKDLLCEELGDLMLQVVFHARISEEAGDFDLDSVADGVCKKLILRHPHIFADVKADTSEEVLKNWDKIKVVEKHQKSDREVLDSVSHSLPSLIRADKLCGKADKLGYSVPENDILSQLAADANDKEKFMGELLFSAVKLARELGIDSEKALADACDCLVETASDVKNEQ